jgi:hypothetical protein
VGDREGSIPGLNPCFSDMEPQQHRHNESVVGHSLNDQNGLPDGIGVWSHNHCTSWLLTESWEKMACFPDKCPGP